MRIKSILGLLTGLLLLTIIPIASAQGTVITWDQWNAQITAHANSPQLDIEETQNITVTSGTIQHGERDFSVPVTLKGLFVALNGGQSQPLTLGSTAGQYQFSSDGKLIYGLPTVANTGDSFIVTIDYTVTETTPGVIDWFTVPLSHSVPIGSTTTTINFPDGNVPDSSQVISTGGAVTAQGSSIVVTSPGPIPANQSFEVQIPYAVNANSATSTPINPSQPITVGRSMSGYPLLLIIVLFLSLLR